MYAVLWSNSTRENTCKNILETTGTSWSLSNTDHQVTTLLRMAPESLKQKKSAKQSFDDELGDDFLSSWKPSKSIAALDFEDDEPAPKNSKASFSLGKMDTNFDFDFDGGLNALSKFNVDTSDLDLPSSCDKTVRTKDSSQVKQKGESKFSFQFDGFDELDLDDTLKTKKEPEAPAHSKKGKRDLGPPSTASKFCKTGLLNSLSDDASESNSSALAGTSINKESRKVRKGVPAAHQGNVSGGLNFSDDEDSMHELGLPLQDKHEQESWKSENYTTEKRKECATTLVNEVMKVTPLPPADVDVSEECDDRFKRGVEVPFVPDLERDERFSIEMDVKLALSSETEAQGLPTEKDGEGMMREEEQTTKVDPAEVTPMKESSKVSCTENEEIAEQKDLFHNVDPSQAAELVGIGSDNVSFSPKHSNEPHTVHAENIPQASHGRSAKRKFSEEQRTSDSAAPSTRNSNRKQEIDEISTKTEGQQVSDSAVSLKKCKDIHTSPPQNHHDTPLLGKTAPTFATDRFIQGIISLNKMAKPSLLQASRLSLGTPGRHSNFQTDSAVEVKSPITSLRNIAAVKKPNTLGGLRSPLLPSTAQLKRSLCQLTAAKDLSSTTFQGRNRPVAEKQLQGLMLHKTSSVAALSKNKAAGGLREGCEKAFKFDVPSSNSTIAHPIAHSSTGHEKLERIEAQDEKLPSCILEKPDTEMADNQVIKKMNNSSDEEIVQTKDDEHPWAVPIQNDDGLHDKAENYANRMDQLLKELKEKYEDAMDLRVRAIVINNTFLMLNNPVDDEKIRKITNYVREKLCPDTQGQVVMQPS